MSFLCDANTFLLLPGQELSADAALRDATGIQTGDLGPENSPDAGLPGPNATLLARQCSVSAVQCFEAGVGDPTTITGYFADSCTIEAVIAPLESSDETALRTIYMCGQGTDYWFWLTHDPHAGTVTVLVNLGGSTAQMVCPAPTMSTDGLWHYIGIRKTVTSGSGTGRLATWDMWAVPITGTWSDTPTHTQTGVANVNPPGGATPFHTVGCRWFGGPNSPGGFYFSGLRASKIARPVSDLRTSFNRFALAGNDFTKPVVGNISPVAGTPLGRKQPVAFDVTDDSGLFRRILVEAFFPELGIREVVHTGDVWGPQYSSAPNAKSAITNGFHFNLLRRGGWLGSAPQLTAYALDTSGNEAA